MYHCIGYQYTVHIYMCLNVNGVLFSKEYLKKINKLIIL